MNPKSSSPVLRLVLITRPSAEWFGNAPAVAGGWLFTGGEWCNVCRTISRLFGHSDLILAALPAHMETLDDFERAVNGVSLARDLRNEASNWTRFPEHKHLALLWADQIETAANSAAVIV